VCACREALKPQMPQDRKTNTLPSSAIAGLEHCVGREASKPQIPQRPATSPRQPLLDSGMCRSRGQNKSRQRQQPAYQLAREQRGEHQGAGLCLAVIEGRVHKYSANAIYRSIHTDTSIVVSMGQIGHDCQRTARRRPNRIDTFAVLRVMSYV
jgi:hypothetical protein